MPATDIKQQIQAALDLHQNGQFEQAEAQYRQILDTTPDNDDLLQLYGTLKLQLGDLPAAQQLLQQAVTINPDNTPALLNLGNVLTSQGLVDQAIVTYNNALKNNLDFYQSYANLGNIYSGQQRWDEAENSYSKALAINPDFDDALNGLGYIRYLQNNTAEALNLHTKARESNPANPVTHNLLAQCYKKAGRPLDAIIAYYHALRLAPGNYESHFGMGNVLYSINRMQDSITAYETALALNPAATDIFNNLGNAYAKTGDTEKAVAMLTQAVEAAPENAEAWNNLGNAQLQMSLADEAVASMKKAIELNPEYVEAYSNLGQTYVKISRPGDALAPLQKARELAPDFAPAYYNLGYALNQCGRTEESYEALRSLLKIKPDMHAAHDTLLFYLSYDYKLTPQQQFEEHKAWGTAHGDPRKKLIKPHRNTPDPARSLKIGYVSPDLGNHPVGHMTVSSLTLHDKKNFQVYYYSNRTNEDSYTDLYKEQAYQWRNILGMGENQIADLIRADGIDILVDLVGHTASSNLVVFAQKPVPVQVSWVGYCETTGLDAIDYLFMDDMTVPKSMDHLFVEEVYRLPNPRFCYAPPSYAPAVSALPAITNGHITFGSFNNLLKLTPDVMKTWSKILKAVPNSKMLINWPTLRDADRREKILDEFKALGIPADRMILLPGDSNHADVLQQYSKIDIALDTFPYSGGITTTESLWMGIPVVTLLGDRAVARQSASIIKSTGFEDWIANTEEEYIGIAKNLASDITRLYNMRKTQRAIISQSAFCDAPRFTHNLEAAYRDIWQRWCENPV